MPVVSMSILLANLTLNDSGSTTHYYTVDGNGLATVNDSGAQTYSFTGGYITGANTYDKYDGYGAIQVVSGGTFTMNAKQAAGLVNVIKPKIAVPIHYGTIVGKQDDADEFERLVDSSVKVVRKIAF